MTIMMKVMLGGAGFAAIAAAAPAAAQYGYGYGHGYANPYGYSQMNNVTNVAAQRCAAAVQNRLSNRSSGGIIGTLLGVNRTGQVLSVTQVVPRRNNVVVRGLASSRVAYNPYGVGAYGMLGSNYAAPADLSFRCSVDYQGYIRDVDINRR